MSGQSRATIFSYITVHIIWNCSRERVDNWFLEVRVLQWSRHFRSCLSHRTISLIVLEPVTCIQLITKRGTVIVYWNSLLLRNVSKINLSTNIHWVTMKLVEEVRIEIYLYDV